MPLSVKLSASNSTTPSMFFLTGVPGLEDMHPQISIPFSTVFTAALPGNSTLLYMMKTEPLHKPMFSFLSMLAVIDLVLSLTTVPKMLNIFWFSAQEITFSACFVQMFFLHSFTIVESVELLDTAFNKYVATCNFLSYSWILTLSLVVRNGLLALARAAGLMSLPFLLHHLLYYCSRVIHCYCKHMTVVELACANTRFSSIIVILFIVGLDLLFITLSSLKILRMVLSLALKEDRLKVFGTCLSHICVILVFYTPVVLSSVIHRFGCHIASHMHILMANFYPNPPMAYGVKIKQIHDWSQDSLEDQDVGEADEDGVQPHDRQDGADEVSECVPVHVQTSFGTNLNQFVFLSYAKCINFQLYRDMYIFPNQPGKRTGSSPLTFILTGIPGLPMSSYWMALPLCCLYLLMLLGNCTLLWMIKTDHSLHTPMYYFLSMLAMADLGLSLSTLPTMLAIFWFESTSLRFEACIVQMYFIHSFSAIESGVLVAMAFDRFVAICYPLQYASVLMSSLIMKAGGVIFMQGICVVLPVAILIKKMPFCRSHVLSHSFCLHQDMLRLVCGDVRVSSLYGLIAVMLTKGLDSLTILLSYVMIVRAILNIVSREARAKAFSTCISHLCAVLIFYAPLIGLSIIHRFGKHLPPLTQTVLADAYLLVPPVLNPLVYSWKTKQIRRRILILLCRRGTQQQV
ncbi:LOW QUALITY PROTEIN: uncharacterized protein RDI95_015639 [Morus bassanus]